MSNDPVYSITHGFPRLRSPQPPTGGKKERWLKQLQGLCHQVDCLQDCSLQSLEKVTRRIEKISKTIPKAWFFKSEEQRLIENAQRVVEQLKKPNLDRDLARPVEGIGIPSLKTLGGIFLLSLYFQSAFGLTPQTFSGGFQTMPEEEPVYLKKETFAARGSTELQLSQPSCNYAPQETLMLRHSVQTGSLSPMEGTSSGTYVAYDTDHSKLAIVKPVNERNEGPQNREAARRKDDLSEEDQYQLNCYRGNPAKRQFVARRLDFGSRACQPQGYIDEMDSDQFFSVEAEKAGRSAGVQRKTVYAQKFVSDATSLVEFHPDFPQDLTKAYQIENNPILDQVPLEEFQKVALLDLLLYNEDRHPGNLLVAKDAEGKPHLIPIDMDMILPGTFQKAPWIGLFTHQRAEERLTPEALAWIQELNPEQVASVIREEGLAEPLIRQGQMLALVLKKLGPDHSIAEISQFIFSKLPSLAELSRKNALKQLPPSDLESYQKSENLRRALWEKRGISSEDEKWYKAYQAEFKQKIEAFLEEKTFVYFKRGLQREALTIKAQKTRHITFGTTYVAGNPDRDALSKLVSDNQQEYAQYWGLNGRVVTESLLQGQCQGLTCVPYWNKVAILKTWLEQPSSGKEEWYILADDDMPVTNMNINPYEAIDLLRKGHDASIIIARDVVHWKGGDRDHSVNTGVLIVRKDQNSKEFIEKLWAKRNDAVSDSPHCRTLGTCKTQDVLHEQEAFARVLKEDPSLLNRVVKVVNYRDRYQGQEIALNTFRRHGCFIRAQDGWKDNAFSYNDPSDGAWQEGDWMGQTAGVPIVGKECGTGVSRFFRLDYLRWMLERIIPIDIDASTSPISHQVRTSETAAKHTAISSLDQELLQEIQTILGRKNYRDKTQACQSLVCSWPQDYEDHVQKTLAKIADPDTKLKAQLSIDEAWEKHIWAQLILDQTFANEGKSYLLKIKDPTIQEKARGYIDRALLRQISSLGKERRFQEATKRVSDIHSAATQEEATRSIATERLAYDQELLQEIQTILGRKNYRDYTRDCKSILCSWPQDYEDDVQETLAKIADPDTKQKAQFSIDEVWEKYILDQEFGNEGKSYLSKIKDPTIQEKARGYIDRALLRQISSLGKERRFQEATKRVSDIHSAATQEEATRSIATERLAYDQELLQEIQTILGRKNYRDYTRDCKSILCSWPQDYEDHVQKTLAKIADPDAKLKAQLSIDEAWAKHILDQKFGNEGKSYLSKIKDAAIQEKARGYIDQVLLRQISSLGKERRHFQEATKRVSDIHSAAIQEEATRSIATERLAYDQELLQEIQTILGRKNYRDYTRDCKSILCSWPQDYEDDVQETLAKIADPGTKLKAQLAIGEAWTKYILDHNPEHYKDTHLARITDKTVRGIAREGLEKRAVEKVKTFTQNKHFEEAGKVISQIQTPSIQKEAQQILDVSLFGRIKHLLTKTKYNPKYDASKSSDCRGCYWPEDLEKTVEKMLSQISDTDIKQQAKKNIDQAWVEHHNKSKSNL